jgi:hypothetical protein
MLKEVIKMNVGSGVDLEFRSIKEVLIFWYEDFKNKIWNCENKEFTYRELKLKIIYDVVLDEKGKVIEETDFITIRKDLEEQINQINEMLEESNK